MASTKDDFRCRAPKVNDDGRCKNHALPNSNYCKYHRYVKAGCYKIKLTSDKWYVGFSKNVQARINEHWKSIAEPNRRTPKWILEHPPVDPLEFKILKKYSSRLPKKINWWYPDENRFTLEMMKKYGIDNVRGGKWVMVDLPKSQREEIEREIEKE